MARQTEGKLTISGPIVEAALEERGQPRTVTLTIPTWDNHDAQIVTALLNEAPLSPLDDLPDALLAALHDHHIDLAPPLEELQPHPAQTPRHLILAAVYKLIQLLDEDPQHAITLRTPVIYKQQRRLVPSDPILLAQIDVDAFYTVAIRHRSSPTKGRQDSRTETPEP